MVWWLKVYRTIKAIIKQFIHLISQISFVISLLVLMKGSNKCEHVRKLYVGSLEKAD